MTENYQKCQKAPTVRKLDTFYFFPLSYNRVILIYLHGKSVVIGFQACGFQTWYYCKTKLYRWNPDIKTHAKWWKMSVKFRLRGFEARSAWYTFDRDMFLLIVTRQKWGSPFMIIKNLSKSNVLHAYQAWYASTINMTFILTKGP